MTRKQMSAAVLFLLTMLLVFASACTPDDKEPPKPAVTKAAWVYIGPPGDMGWTYAHNLGRLAVEDAMQNVETSYVENVPEDDAEADIQKLVDDGNKIIFTTSFGYMDATLAVADANPNVYFEHCSGYKTADKMSNYFGRMYQARYLTGMVAASMTTTKKIGIAAAVPIPEVIRHINAITRGARSVDPDVEVHVEWVNAWYDPATAGDKATTLLDAGCDVIFQDTDSAAAITIAQQRGAYGVGYHSDILSIASDTVLTSAMWNWGEYYTQRIQAVIDGDWSSQSYWGGIDTGIVALGGWGSMVPQAVRDRVETARAALAAGEFDVFDGPCNKQDGSEWVAAGSSMSDEDMLNMYGWVEGVVADPLP